MPDNFELDEAKYRTLVAYIGYRTSGVANFGSILLNKVLVDCEFTHYRVTGRPLTGQSIQRQPMGPISNMLPLHMRALERNGVLKQDNGEYYGFKQNRIVVECEPNMEGFTDLERDIIDNRIAYWSRLDGRQASDASHKIFGAWKFLDNGDPIPYESSIISCFPLSQEAKDYALELV